MWGKQKNRYEIIQKANTVEALQNGRLGDRRKWRLWRDLNKSQCMDCPPKKEMAVVERWPVSGGSTVSYLSRSHGDSVRSPVRCFYTK